MTIKQLSKKSFSVNSRVLYKGFIYPVVVVDWEESLIGIPSEEWMTIDDVCDPDRIKWVRCENVDLLPDNSK